MGQRIWVGACALVGACYLAGRLIAQEPGGDPFGEATSPSEQSASPSSAEDQIEEALNQRLRSPWDFPETPLNTIMRVISEEYQIPIVFDTKAIEAVGLSPETEVNISIANVSLRSALALMLKNVEDLTSIIDNEVLLITTEDEAETRLEVRVYRVDDLVCEVAADGARDIDNDRFESLHDIIIDQVAYDSWAENGTGEGELSNFVPGMFVVTQTRRVHDQIGRVLAEMRAVKAEIESSSPGGTTAHRAVTRGFRIVSDDFTSTPESRAAIRDGLRRSTDWDGASAGLDEDDVFLEVLPHRVLVRHLPAVVRDVERVLKQWGAAPVDETGAQTPRPGMGFSRVSGEAARRS